MASKESAFDLLSYGDSGWGDELLRGAGLTLQISAGAFCIGLLIGIAVAGIKLKGGRFSVFFANTYTTIGRAVPELLLIILLFYSGPALINAFLHAFGYQGQVEISAFVSAMAVLGLVQGAYASEILRGAILSIPKGQIEAAVAYGMTPFTRFRRVILPAMLPYAIGGLANLWLILIKDSALVSVVGFSELLYSAKQAAGSTRRYFLFYLAAAGIYFLMTVLSNILIKHIEKRARRGHVRA